MGVILAGMFTALAMFVLIFLIGDWSDSSSDGPLMKFDQWHDIYLVRPDRWTLYSSGPAVNIGWTNETRISFSFVDYYRYQRWLKEERKRELERNNNKELQRILEQTQGDIEELKKRADEEMEQAVRDVKMISKRISEME